MNARKSLALTAALAVTALGLAACSSGGGNDTPTGGATSASGTETSAPADYTATLFACHPPGSTAYRYVVHLRLVSAPLN